MVYEENSDNDNGDPTINPTSKAPSSASEANTSKLLGPDDKIAGADPVDNIEIDVTATATAICSASFVEAFTIIKEWLDKYA
jgi:hypothetical protein